MEVTDALDLTAPFSIHAKSITSSKNRDYDPAFVRWIDENAIDH